MWLFSQQAPYVYTACCGYCCSFVFESLHCMRLQT